MCGPNPLPYKLENVRGYLFFNIISWNSLIDVENKWNGTDEAEQDKCLFSKREYGEMGLILYI